MMELTQRLVEGQQAPARRLVVAGQNGEQLLGVSVFFTNGCPLLPPQMGCCLQAAG